MVSRICITRWWFLVALGIISTPASEWRHVSKAIKLSQRVFSGSIVVEVALMSLRRLH